MKETIAYNLDTPTQTPNQRTKIFKKVKIVKKIKIIKRLKTVKLINKINKETILTSQRDNASIKQSF
jgi:hypothetical protein